MKLKTIIALALFLIIVPIQVSAQVIFPNRGGTGLSSAPGANEFLVGDGTNYNLKTLAAGDNMSITHAASTITLSASIPGGGLTSANIDTEAELEALVTDVSNFFTNNDGSLADDDVSDDELNDLANTSLADPNADQIVFWDDSAGQYRFLTTYSALSISGTSLAVDVSGDWTGTLDGLEGSAYALDTDIDDLSGVTNASTARSNLGLVIGTNVQAYDADLSVYAGITPSANVQSILSAANYAAIRTLLDLEAGTDFYSIAAANAAFQPIDADLTAIAALANTDSNFIVGNGTAWVAESGATVRTSLGLGSLATLSTISNSNWSGTDLSVANGGTGASTLTQGGVLYGNGTGAITDSGVLTAGQLLIGDGTTFPTVATLTQGTGMTISNGAGSITLATTLGTAIDTSEITDDTITFADIDDSDQAATLCAYIEDPTADDDLQSLWANKTANDFQLTEIWAESDQTVAFDLQVDDGTPADVNGTDITPAAGEAEDTTLSGDTTVAAGEELDLIVTSVSGTPTWISICWTGQWVD